MRISFDLDEVLFVDPDRFETEPPLPFPLDRIFIERLRKGTVRLIREVQRDRSETLPQKMPGFYRISLHIDDEDVIHQNGLIYGFRTFKVCEPDDQWVEKVLAEANRIRRIEEEENNG